MYVVLIICCHVVTNTMWLLFLPLCLELRVHPRFLECYRFYVKMFLYPLPPTYSSKTVVLLRLVQVQDLHGPQEEIFPIFKIEMTVEEILKI